MVSFSSSTVLFDADTIFVIVLYFCPWTYTGKLIAICIQTIMDKLSRTTWPEMTDIINILIRCEFAYHVAYGFICEYKIVLRDVLNRKLCE